MTTQITVDPPVLEEAVAAIQAEHRQLAADQNDYLKMVKGETEEAANHSEFAWKFAVLADALVRKADNVLQELKNYGDLVLVAEEELSRANRDAERGVEESWHGM
jgi:hypothetical protein